MANAKLRVGLIGANANSGWGSRTHVPAIKALPELDLVAVCTAHKETAEEAARKFGVPLAFHDPEAMVSHRDVDLVIVSVKAPLHYQMTMLALQAGKHVYCEWPFGSNIQQSIEMRDLAVSEGVHHMAGLQLRASPAFNYLKELIAEGFIGEPVTCTMVANLLGGGTRTRSYTYSANVANGSNPLTIAASHQLDGLCFVLGEFRELTAKVTTVFRKARVIETGEVLDMTSPDNVVVAGSLQRGTVVSAHVTNIPFHSDGSRLAIYGTEGTLVALAPATLQMSDVTLLAGQKEDKTLKPLEIPARHRWVPSNMPTGSPYNVGQMLRKLASAIRDGAPVGPDFNEGVGRKKTIEAIKRASETGQRQVL